MYKTMNYGLCKLNNKATSKKCVENKKSILMLD